jgi:hypothetical protein
MPETAPHPLLGTLHQPPLDRIAVQVAQLLDQLALTPHIEVIIALLPERAASGKRPQLTPHVLLEHLNRQRQLAPLGLADQQVHVLGHDHVSAHVEPVPLPNPLQRPFEDPTRLRRSQQGSAMVATEGDEVQKARLLKPLQSPGHDCRMSTSPTRSGDRRTPPPCLSKQRRDKDGPPGRNAVPELPHDLEIYQNDVRIQIFCVNMKHQSEAANCWPYRYVGPVVVSVM